jgi:integrase
MCYLCVTYVLISEPIIHEKIKMPKLKLTLTAVDKLPFAEKSKQVDYWDTELKGFGCRVSSRSKTYIVMKRINGKQTRVNLGRHGVIKTDKARTKAISTLAQLNDGIDVNREKARDRVRGNTLKEVFEDYLESRPDMKPHTIAVDRSLLKCHLSDWKNKPIKDITRDMVAKRHLKIAKASSGVTANNAMRLVRRIYNFALSVSDGELTPNPVLRLSDSRQWFNVERRQTVLKEHELPYWYSAVQKLDNPTIRDYLLLLLFTGLRKNEALKLKWDDVDFKNGTFTIKHTKNRKPLTLPMSDLLEELFKRRLEMKENSHVFPGTGKDGHLIEPKRQIKIIERETQKNINGIMDDEEFDRRLETDPNTLEPGVGFCLHDLRRTFASIAESLVSYSALKRLMNHSDKDVTQGYIVFDVNKLRGPMQTVTSEICRLSDFNVTKSKSKTARKKNLTPNREQLSLLF